MEPSTAMTLTDPPNPSTEMTTAIVPVNPPAKIIVREPTDAEFEAIALLRGFSITPIASYKKELALSLVARLRTREGKHLYQMAAYHLPLFSRTAAKAILPASLLQSDTQAVLTWKAATQAEVATMLGSMLSEEAPYCFGATRCLKKPSEREIYAAATIIPDMEISWVKKPSGEGLYINFQYVLSDEAGEIHPPKDSDHVEISLDAPTMAAVRQQILDDTTRMISWGFPLSAGWRRRMGSTAEEAATAAAAAAARPKKRAPRPRAPRQRAPKSLALKPPPRHEGSSSEEDSSSEEAETSSEEEEAMEAAEVEPIECEILEEVPTRGRAKVWYRVEWDQTRYEPSWERFRRIPGAVGTPLQTWEDLATMDQTPALKRWMEREQAG